MSDKVNAIILGGGDGEAIVPGVAFKGLVEVAGKPMVQWVAEAMAGADSVEEVAVVVPTTEGMGAWTEGLAKVVMSQASFIENALAGLDSFEVERPVVVCTGDIPALTPIAVDDYVRRSRETGAELTYPLVLKSDVLEQFPGSERTFVPIEGGPVTGGNMVYSTPELMRRNAELTQKLFETRKSVVQWAMIIGPVFIARLVSGNLRPKDVEKKLSKMTGGKCRAVYTPYASIGADVDKPWDLPVTERVIQQRSAP